LNKEHQRRVRELFDAALDQPVHLRREFLDRAVNGDRHLFEAVEKLLRASERSAGVLDTPIRQRAMVDTDPRRPGSSVGAYKVLQRLSGGGMGIVYQAVRADEVYQRICAVKVIRPELCSNWLVERFKQERRILGKLDHINIARIVDGGSTQEGLLYFRRERVDHTLQTTGLVHEAYLRLFGTDNPPTLNNREHFFAVAATQMRRILVDHARQNCAQSGRASKFRSMRRTTLPADAMKT
jgi:hypothetical protein